MVLKTLVSRSRNSSVGIRGVHLGERKVNAGEKILRPRARVIVATISSVMPGLVPGIHDIPSTERNKTWMAGTSPGHDVDCRAGKRRIRRSSREAPKDAPLPAIAARFAGKSSRPANPASD